VLYGLVGSHFKFRIGEELTLKLDPCVYETVSFSTRWFFAPCPTEYAPRTLV
jgi:hypothetical protein